MTVHPIVVVVPVFNARPHLERCLASIDAWSPDAEVLAIDDASTDPSVRTLLRHWETRRPGHQFLAHDRNRGFVGTANAGIRRAPGDVVLLNSDTEVTPGWLEALQRCLASSPDIATATPWTNNGEIASYPAFCSANPPPADAAAIGRALRLHGQRRYPELPTAVGFCMAISRRAIDAVGVFDEEAFGPGYGEENDYSLRARAAGLRNVLCDDAYVVHHGNASFGPLGLAPGEESMRRLLARHPDYLREVTEFIREDPLAPSRAALTETLARAGVQMS